MLQVCFDELNLHTYYVEKGAVLIMIMLTRVVGENLRRYLELAVV